MVYLSAVDIIHYYDHICFTYVTYDFELLELSYHHCILLHPITTIISISKLIALYLPHVAQTLGLVPAEWPRWPYGHGEIRGAGAGQRLVAPWKKTSQLTWSGQEAIVIASCSCY